MSIFRVFYYFMKWLLFISPKRLLFSSLMRRSFTVPPLGVFLVRSMVGPLFVHGARALAYVGAFEKDVLQTAKCLFKKYGPGLFVDVGAYVGLYSVLAAKFGWRVLAFEPNPLSLLLLKYNLLMNRVNNLVLVVNKAVGDREGIVTFRLGMSPSESSLTKFLSEDRVGGIVRVEIVPLDVVLEEARIYELLVMKIDVEGAGFEVLKGALKSIKTYRPYIIFEVHKGSDEVKEFLALALLKHLSYRFMVLEWRSHNNFIVLAYPQERGCPCCKRKKST